MTQSKHDTRRWEDMSPGEFLREVQRVAEQLDERLLDRLLQAAVDVEHRAHCASALPSIG